MTSASRMRKGAAEEGFWHRPALMNLVSDLLIIASSIALAWVFALLLVRLPFFPLHRLTIESELNQVSRAQLEYAVRTAIQGNFFTVDLDEARTGFEKLPWVRRAELRRQWPDGLQLTLEEHVAVARWQGRDGETRLVNRYGELFTAAGGEALPVFTGPESAVSEIMAFHEQASRVLADIGRRPVAVLLSPRQAWRLWLDDGVLIEIGREDGKLPLAERLARLGQYYPTALAKAGNPVAVVDLRYPGGFVLRPGQPAKTGAEAKS